MSISNSINRILALAYKPLLPRQQPAPTPTPVPGDDGGVPLPGDDGGQSGGGSGDGQIKGPTFSDPAGGGASGLFGSGKVPPGFIPVGGEAPGYFYNPQTNRIGVASGGEKDIYGDPRFTWRLLTAKEQDSFISSLGGGAPASAGGGSGDGGVAMGNLAQRQREAEWTMSQDRIKNAQDYVTMLMNSGESETARKALTNKSILDALPFVARPGQTYFSGLAPGDYGVNAGYASATPIVGVTFDPRYAEGSSYAQQIAEAQARLRALEEA